MLQPFLDFELTLNSLAGEEVVAHEWGRAFLSPGLPLVWDANWILIEQAGMTAPEVAAVADEALAGFAHRTVVVADEDEGARLGAELGTMPDWRRETSLYMEWEGDNGRSAAAAVREGPLAACENLRRELIRAELPPGTEQIAEMTAQLLESNRRLGAASGDRWFVAPAEEPTSACCLMSRDGIGQIEEVGTLPAARGQGLAQAVVLAALDASRAAGNRVTFLTAAGDDWPLLMYEKLGFVVRGRLTTLRRLPT
jgi:ribosomal protein S18 acetylase RimI-like enzyme